jgi:hypothetical protein
MRDNPDLVEDLATRVAATIGDPKLRRRTIAAGMAWAAPAMVLASATPAYAASCGDALGTLTAVSVNGPGFTGANYMCHETSPNNTAFYRNTQEICYTAVFTNNTLNTLTAGNQTIRLDELSLDYKTIRLASATSSLGGSVPISTITYSRTTNGDPNSPRFTMASTASGPNPRMEFVINKSIAPGETITFVYCTKWVKMWDTSSLPQDGQYPSIRVTSPCGTSSRFNNSIYYNDAYATQAAVLADCSTCVCP